MMTSVSASSLAPGHADGVEQLITTERSATTRRSGCANFVPSLVVNQLKPASATRVGPPSDRRRSQRHHCMPSSSYAGHRHCCIVGSYASGDPKRDLRLGARARTRSIEPQALTIMTRPTDSPINNRYGHLPANATLVYAGGLQATPENASPRRKCRENRTCPASDH